MTQNWVPIEELIIIYIYIYIRPLSLAFELSVCRGKAQTELDSRENSVSYQTAERFPVPNQMDSTLLWQCDNNNEIGRKESKSIVINAN